MASKEYWDERLAQARARRAAADARLRRHIETGRVKGEILSSGAISRHAPKGFVPYSTRELVTRVTEIMDRNERSLGRRICHINGRWQLQIRGKDLRRLLKAMPRVRQVGRALVEEGPST